MDHFPVVLICRDRLDCTRRLVGWFERHGFDTIVLLDNASTYAPLLEWYETSPHTVVRLRENVGPYAPWSTKYIEKNFRRQWVIVSDPDVLPVDDCPDDAFDQIYRLMKRHPLTSKVGFSLRIDDIPGHNPGRDLILNCERHHLADDWRVGQHLYRAPVDTTLALYRPGGYFEIGGFRMAPPILARHLPWYDDPDALPEDVEYYLQHAAGNEANGGKWNPSAPSAALLATTDWDAHDRVQRRNRLMRDRVRRAAKLRLAPYRR